MSLSADILADESGISITFLVVLGIYSVEKDWCDIIGLDKCQQTHATDNLFKWVSIHCTKLNNKEGLILFIVRICDDVCNI